MAPPIPAFADLLATCTTGAVHQETRDGYSRQDDAFRHWQHHRHLTTQDTHRWWGPWVGLAGAAVARGVSIRRARVVSEPLSDYTRYEYDITGDLNVAAGEQVRWLARTGAPHALLVPVNDFWVFDDHTALIFHHDGGGEETERLLCTDQDVVTVLRRAFEDIWAAATAHQDYRPR
jgi:hypothetical protein